MTVALSYDDRPGANDQNFFNLGHSYIQSLSDYTACGTGIKTNKLYVFRCHCEKSASGG
jgi:hypothetical protein